MEKYFTIAGYGKYRYPKRISQKKANELYEKGKPIFTSYSEAKEKAKEMNR